MRTALLSTLFLTTSIAAELPCFEVSLGVGVQNDRAYLTGFDPMSSQKSIQNKFSQIWTPYGRLEVGAEWRSCFASYTADLGGGSSGNLTSSLRIGSGTAPVPVFTASLSNSQVWNQKVTFGYELPVWKNLSIKPLIGWNQYQSKWKVGTSNPAIAPNLADVFGPGPVPGTFALSQKGSHITERFSGAFIGGDLNFFLDCFEASLGYRYSFGSFYTNIEHVHFEQDALSFPASLAGDAQLKTVLAQAEAQLGNARLGYRLNAWYFYVEGEGRWIQKTQGQANVKDTITVNVNGMTQNQFQNQFFPCKARWISYAITLGTQYSF